MKAALPFLLIILVSTVCWLLCTLYIKLISDHYSKKIINCTDVSVSCKYRKTYRLLLKCEKLIFAVLAIIGTFCIFEIVCDLLNLRGTSLPDNYFSSPVFWMIFGLCESYYILLMMSNTAYSPISKVTSLTVHDVKDNYILFLRGFGCDNYLNMSYQEKKQLKSVFSEHQFVKRISSVMRSYAIGRPEELLNPSGADRIYLNNDTWKSDVSELMEKAKGIVILINDKPNCIWEIIQSEKMRRKVLYIVNNRFKYESVCENLSYLRIDEVDADRFYMYFDSNDNIVWKPFTNDKNSYWDVIRDFRKVIGI